MRLDKLEI